MRPSVLILSALVPTTGLCDPVPVNAFNFIRAETDTYFDGIVKSGGLGTLVHTRDVAPIDAQSVIRMNRDTLYSSGVYDLDAGPITVTIPETPDNRYVAVEVISEDHYAIDVLHDGAHELTKDNVGTRYVGLFMRVFANPNDPADMTAAHAVQDSVKVEQAAVGTFEIPDWDKATQDRTRAALLELDALGGSDPLRRMGREDEVDPLSHLLVTASGWGLNPPSEAMYVSGFPPQNDGKTVYRLVLEDVPVDGFWSVSVYNKDGFFEPNDLNAYSVNNVTATADADGAYTIQFGGCDGTIPNCLPITDGWNYAMRLYRPRAEVLNGTWKAPEPEPAN